MGWRGVSHHRQHRPLIAGGQRRPLTHVVGVGDTFFAIGRRYGVGPQAVAAVNGLTFADTLRLGQRIRLPAGARDRGPEAARAGGLQLAQAAPAQDSVRPTLVGMGQADQAGTAPNAAALAPMQTAQPVQPAPVQAAPAQTAPLQSPASQSPPAQPTIPAPAAPVQVAPTTPPARSGPVTVTPAPSAPRPAMVAPPSPPEIAGGAGTRVETPPPVQPAGRDAEDAV